MTTKTYSPLFLFFLFSQSVNAQNIFINEVMADNENGLTDFENETSDWLEIYNAEDMKLT